MSAMPIGMPACPELARSTASMESARMALASSGRVVMRTSARPVKGAKFRGAPLVLRPRPGSAHCRGAHCPPVTPVAQITPPSGGLRRGARPETSPGCPDVAAVRQATYVPVPLAQPRALLHILWNALGDPRRPTRSPSRATHDWFTAGRGGALVPCIHLHAPPRPRNRYAPQAERTPVAAPGADPACAQGSARACARARLAAGRAAGDRGHRAG